MKVHGVLRGAAGVAAMVGVVSVQAQQWPAEKPVRMIVPFAPGGGTDIQARLLTAALQRSTGQTFLVDNRTGASGLIGAQLAVDAAPDGYTIFFTSGSLAVVTTLYAKRMKFDPLTDLAPVSWLSTTPLVLSVHPSVPVKTVRQFVALAKSKPGVLTAGGNTVGSTAHLSAEMFNQVTGAKATVVTYRGGGPATVALISGETDFIFATAPSVIPHLRTGKARAIAVTTAKPSPFFPDLPTMNSVYPGFETDNWYGAFYPKNTPRAIIDRMNAELAKAQATPEVKKFMVSEALEAVSSTPDALTDKFKRDIAKYAKVIADANIRAD